MLVNFGQKLSHPTTISTKNIDDNNGNSNSINNKKDDVSQILQLRFKFDGVSGPNRFDFEDRRFAEWFHCLGGLLPSESATDFVLRCNNLMARTLTISHSRKKLVAPEVIESGACTCHGSNSVLVSALRRVNLPALVQHGLQIAQKHRQKCIFGR